MPLRKAPVIKTAAKPIGVQKTTGKKEYAGKHTYFKDTAPPATPAPPKPTTAKPAPKPAPKPKRDLTPAVESSSSPPQASLNNLLDDMTSLAKTLEAKNKTATIVFLLKTLRGWEGTLWRAASALEEAELARVVDISKALDRDEQVEQKRVERGEELKAEVGFWKAKAQHLEEKDEKLKGNQTTKRSRTKKAT